MLLSYAHCVLGVESVVVTRCPVLPCQVEGNVFVVYNMGTEDHPVGEVMSKVNDGMYHVVRFIRSGPNATVQIDDYEIQENNPSGESAALAVAAALT